MRRLTGDLDALAALRGEPVTVIFDGRPFDLEGDTAEVRFASRRGPNAADDDIAALVEADPSPHDLRVVTSDGPLAARVAQAGAEVLGAGAFRRTLDELGEEPANGGRRPPA
jgi:uncharacterized protein YaiI (UPF0178 family)